MRDRNFELKPIHASMIISFPEFTESYAPFRKNTNVLVYPTPFKSKIKMTLTVAVKAQVPPPSISVITAFTALADLRGPWRHTPQGTQILLISCSFGRIWQNFVFTPHPKGKSCTDWQNIIRWCLPLKWFSTSHQQLLCNNKIILFVLLAHWKQSPS